MPSGARGESGLDHDGQDARALLAGRLGDQLLGPVGEADDAASRRRRCELVAQRVVPADRRAEHERRGSSASSIASSSELASASSSSSPMSTPASPLGTSPNAVSAE